MRQARIPAVMAAATVLSCLAAALRAEPPKLEALFPAGGRAGSSFVLAASGRVEEGARLWTETPGIHFVPTGKKREWQATVEAGVPAGLYLVHAANADGASAPRWFSVGTLPEVAEVEPNNEAGHGMPIEKLPVCVNARLEQSGDVDGFKVKLAAGQAMAGLVEAYSLGSPVDVMLHILDPGGIRVHTASDGRSLDPEFVFKAEKSGEHTVQIAGFAHPPQANVAFTAGATVVYRLHLSTGPVVTRIHPPAIAAAGKTTVTLSGIGLDPRKLAHSIDAPAGAQPGEVIQVVVPGALQPLQVLVSESAPQQEKEPNNERDKATPVKAGVVAGKITGREDSDRFSIEMKKGEKLQASVWAKRLGLPLDAALTIEDPQGKVLASIADAGDEADPAASWTAAVDGPHQIVVRDQFNLGEEDGHYALEIGPARPGFTATLADAKALVIERGKSASLKVTVKLLNGFKDPLTARVSGLPAGMHAPEVAVPEKGGEVEIKLHAAANAPAGGALTRVELWGKSEPARVTPASAAIRGEDKRGTTLRDDTNAVWTQVR